MITETNLLLFTHCQQNRAQFSKPCILNDESYFFYVTDEY